MSSHAIDEIEERLQDLTDALREAQSPDFARRLEQEALDFTEPKRVRRSVNTIRMQLESFRQTGTGLPETPKVLLAANRLEDACREALAAGVIAAAPLSLAAQSRRKLAIALMTLLCGAFALLIPIVLVRLGVDFQDLNAERRMAPRKLPRGEEDSMEVAALVAMQLPRATTGAAFEPLSACRQPLPDGSMCTKVPPRLWPEGRLPTYELKLKHQAYGLLFAITEPRLRAGVATARLLLAATDETPEGHYELRLAASYLGYTPQVCEPLQRVRGACPEPRAGDGERHADVPVPVVVVDVVPGDPSKRLGDKRLAAAEAEEARRKAEQRATQIEAAVTEIKAALGETEKLVARKRWEDAKRRVDKLGVLFQPLESLVLGDDAVELPPAVSEVRGRYDALHDQLAAFERRIFDRTFTVVTAESNQRVPEDRLIERVAGEFRVAPAYVQEIYTANADEMQRRLEARAQQHLDRLKREQAAREQRCGALPTHAWSAIEHYLRQRITEVRTEVVLGECMSPRLTEKDCWEVRCEYQRRIEVAVERPKEVTKHAATFYLVNERIIRHLDR